MSIDEAYRKLEIGRTTFFEELRAGRVRSIKVGARRLIPLTALQDYVDDRLAENLEE